MTSVLFCKRHNDYETGTLQDRINDAREASAHPGKYEGEPAIVPMLHALALDGCADEEGGDVEAAGYAYRLARWVLVEDSQGFVTGRQFRTVELARLEIEQIEDYASALYSDEDEQGEDDSEPFTRCDQCNDAMINGVYCHEIGCPNAREGR